MKNEKMGQDFLFHDGDTAVSYKTKIKLMILISMMHSNSEVNQSMRKPEIIRSYF